MPYDETITQTKITTLEQKNQDLRSLVQEVEKILMSLRQLLDIREQDKEADGTPKIDGNGSPVFINIMPIDQDTMERLTPARRTTVYDKMIAAADIVLAKTA